MKPDTRNYGKNHRRFRQGFAGGGMIKSPLELAAQGRADAADMAATGSLNLPTGKEGMGPSRASVGLPSSRQAWEKQFYLGNLA